MRLKLKYFLLFSLIMGAFVAPLTYREYQKWQQRRRAEVVKPRVVAIRYVAAVEMAAILKQVYGDYLKPQGEATKPELSVVADAATNTLTIFAKPKLLDEVRDLIDKIDQQSGPQWPTLRVTPVQPIRKTGPAFNDISFSGAAE